MLSDEEYRHPLSIASVHNKRIHWKSNRIGLQGAKVALLGDVNAGKSSLFNSLLGFERAL